MRQAGLYSRRRPRRRVRTTDSAHTRPVAANLLQRDFSATAANQKWLGDILAIWTAEGWLYLAALLDTYSRKIVGWAMSSTRDEALVTHALAMALRQRTLNGDTSLIHHSDRGSQYSAAQYRALLSAHDIHLSMSAKGDPYDNAMMESFFSTLRAELTDLHTFATFNAARSAVFEFIEVFYNRQRLHSSLGYLSPTDFEATLFLDFSSPPSTKAGQDQILTAGERGIKGVRFWRAHVPVFHSLLVAHCFQLSSSLSTHYYPRKFIYFLTLLHEKLSYNQQMKKVKETIR
jgi:putative transposase